MVPNEDGTLTPRKGRYYFVDGNRDFIPRSMLGGHWFEDKPYQTGPWSTANSPRPVWVNGASPAMGEGMNVGCACGLIDSPVSRAEGVFTFPNPLESFSGSAHALVWDGFGLNASFGPIPGVNSVVVQLPADTCAPTCGTPLCYPPAEGILTVETGISDPTYMATLMFPDCRLSRGGVDPLSCRLHCSAQVRLFRAA